MLLIAGIAGIQAVTEIQEVEAESSSGVAALTPTAHRPSNFMSRHAEKCQGQGDSDILNNDFHSAGPSTHHPGSSSSFRSSDPIFQDEPVPAVQVHGGECSRDVDSGYAKSYNELYSQFAQPTRRFPNPDGRDFYAARRSRGDDINASCCPYVMWAAFAMALLFLTYRAVGSVVLDW
ncbi:hypothetical protein PCASD_14937 [Puccinia coronata f. sp. avenae]|uniref:Uncharacterized protein n=1 Tax=Puccinia coronata f. sp. avenae TaxID=200324 RepID=A0A2N5TF41_9BASI|nr:hypothetical protein PCASD_14937 [Puccinia coronata f. sp. avenae]